jgi:hypothetical protein
MASAFTLARTIGHPIGISTGAMLDHRTPSEAPPAAAPAAAPTLPLPLWASGSHRRRAISGYFQTPKAGVGAP